MFGSIACLGNPDEKYFGLIQVKAAFPSAPPPYSGIGLQTETHPLQDGDLLRVFNSIADGTKLLDIRIDLELEEKSPQDFQKDFDRHVWASLFALRLPARLTKNGGESFEGMLDPFYETGMEHTAWTLYDFRRLGYGSLHSLEKGDLLEVFTSVTAGNIEWQGRVRIKPEPFATGQKITVIHYDESLRDDYTAFSQSMTMTPVEEVFLHTLEYPEREKLDSFALNHLPLQLVR